MEPIRTHSHTNMDTHTQVHTNTHTYGHSHTNTGNEQINMNEKRRMNWEVERINTVKRVQNQLNR